MKQQKFSEGYVIVAADGFLLDWSFKFYRTDCIAEFVKDSGQTWNQWYAQGVRCSKATKTIKIS